MGYLGAGGHGAADLVGVEALLDVPGDHGVEAVAGLLVAQGGPEAADLPALLELSEQGQDFVLGAAGHAGDVRVGRGAVGQGVLDDAQDVVFRLGELHVFPRREPEESGIVSRPLLTSFGIC